MTYEVVITDSTYPDAEIERDVLRDADATVTRADARTPSAVIDAARGADALLNQETELTAEVFEALDGLRAVARYGVGTDNVDVEAAADHDVTVCNVPSYCEDEVSTHALSLLLACARNVSQYDERVKAGEWDWKDGRPLKRLRGRTLGFVAFGNIPRRLAEKASGFGLDYVAYDPYQSPEALAAHGVEKVSFGELLDRADLLSVHAPLTDETRNLLDADAFERLPADAIVVNVGRGGVVDEDALRDALDRGQIAAAGLDVLADEPPETSPLFERDDVVLTPHAAWYSEESIVDLRRSAAKSIARILRGEDVENAVNDA